MSLDFLLVALASLLAGLVDAIVGGGGLILVPALFTAFPAAPAATLLGTNKFAAIWGTGMAAVRYGRSIVLDWRLLLPAVACTLVGSFMGAWAVTRVDSQALRRVLPLLLLLVLIYALVNKHLGHVHEPRHSPQRQRLIACAIGLGIGGYDGFFGPGTGSFFLFLFVRLLGYDFLHASASAKVLNVAANVAAITLFSATGHVWWQVGLLLAIANIIGSVIGTRLALKHGVGFVRVVFVCVVAALVLKTGYDAYLR